METAGLLDLNWMTVLWQAVNFLVLTAALYFILFKPALKGIRAQREKREAAEAQLAADRAEVAQQREQLASRLTSAEEEAAALVSRAQNQADTDRAVLLQEAQTEVERVMAEAQMDAMRLRRQAINEFHDELLEAVLDVSGLVIGRVAPEELHSSMIEQLCTSVWDLGQTDMRRVDALRRSLGERTPTVMARTAQPLTAEQQGLVVRTFSALADRNINLDVKVEPSVGLGMRVRLGDLVLDNTIAGRLDDLRGSVVEALDERITSE